MGIDKPSWPPDRDRERDDRPADREPDRGTAGDDLQRFLDGRTSVFTGDVDALTDDEVIEVVKEQRRRMPSPPNLLTRDDPGEDWLRARQEPSVADSVDRADAPAPFDHQIAEQVPEYTKRIGTVGILADQDSNQIWDEPQGSGYNGPAKDAQLPLPSSGAWLRSHVEMHTAAYMREHGIDEATLYINRRPCPLDRPPEHPARTFDLTCDNYLPEALPAGSKLTVYAPDGFEKVYIGRDEEETP